MLVHNGTLELFTYQVEKGWAWRINDHETGEWVARSERPHKSENDAYKDAMKNSL